MVGFSSIRRGPRGSILLSVMALSAAGCVSEAPPHGDVASLYVGADRLSGAAARESETRMAINRSIAEQEVVAANAAGVVGPGAVRTVDYAPAEQGPCGAYAKIEQNQSLNDIARECNVSRASIVAYNPGIDEPGLATEGLLVAIPPRSWSAVVYSAPTSAGGFGWYVSRAGDTLQTIAASHLTTPAELIRLNPGLTESLPIGQTLKVPASMSAASSAAAPAAIASRLTPGDNGSSAMDGYAYPVSRAVTAVMPYNQRPRLLNGDGVNKAPSRLLVSRRVAPPGGKVIVSGENLPANSDVSLYRGSNGRDMQYVGKVKTDANGDFSQPVRIKRSSDLGGVIFKARVDDTGEGLQSDRVGVDRLKGSDELQEYDDDTN